MAAPCKLLIYLCLLNTDMPKVLALVPGGHDIAVNHQLSFPVRGSCVFCASFKTQRSQSLTGSGFRAGNKKIDVKENTSRVTGEAAVEVRNMRIQKSIGGKLYMGFGLIMAIVVFAFIVNWLAVRHEQTTRALYKKSITMVENLSKLERARNQNRLFLRNFLLNGDRRESDQLTRGESEVESLIADIKENGMNLGDTARIRQLLDQLSDAERDWGRTFATPLMEKRRQVDTGSATVAELQIAYLQATPTPEQKQREEQPMLQLAAMTKQANKDAEESD